jgi:hypothetical protein
MSPTYCSALFWKPVLRVTCVMSILVTVRKYRNDTSSPLQHRSAFCKNNFSNCRTRIFSIQSIFVDLITVYDNGNFFTLNNNVVPLLLSDTILLKIFCKSLYLQRTPSQSHVLFQDELKEGKKETVARLFIKTLPTIKILMALLFWVLLHKVK